MLRNRPQNVNVVMALWGNSARQVMYRIFLLWETFNLTTSFMEMYPYEILLFQIEMNVLTLVQTTVLLYPILIVPTHTEGLTVLANLDLGGMAYRIHRHWIYGIRPMAVLVMLYIWSVYCAIVPSKALPYVVYVLYVDLVMIFDIYTQLFSCFRYR